MKRIIFDDGRSGQIQQKVNREIAEYIIQQCNGRIVGIETATDEDLAKLLPSQFVLVQPVDK